MSASAKLAILLAVIVPLTAGIYLQVRRYSTADEITYSKFLRELDGDQIAQVDVRGKLVSGVFHDGKTFHVQLPYLDPQLSDDIAQHCEATFREDDSLWQSLLLFGLAALIVGWLLGILWKSAIFSPRQKNPSPPI